MVATVAVVYFPGLTSIDLCVIASSRSSSSLAFAIAQMLCATSLAILS